MTSCFLVLIWQGVEVRLCYLFSFKENLIGKLNETLTFSPFNNPGIHFSISFITLIDSASKRGSTDSIISILPTLPSF
tara:strand:- start:11959 stop:12192 length:234 start_codon:yes stop_codon:yes gene_type:complete